MDLRILIVATALGLGAQIAMVVAGHYVPFIKNNVFAIGGMLISLAAGLAYARLAAEGWGPSVAGGAIAGGVCALVGIGVSVALKDTLVPVLIYGTVGSAVAGGLGGAIGKLIA